MNPIRPGCWFPFHNEDAQEQVFSGPTKEVRSGQSLPLAHSACSFCHGTSHWLARGPNLPICKMGQGEEWGWVCKRAFSSGKGQASSSPGALLCFCPETHGAGAGVGVVMELPRALTRLCYFYPLCPGEETKAQGIKLILPTSLHFERQNYRE